MKILSVLPLKKGVLKGNLSYFSALDIKEGHIVEIPIKNKKNLALVISAEELKETKGDVKKMDFNLRKISENKGESIFLKEFLETTFDVAKYFVQNKNNTVSALIPKIFLEEYDTLAKNKNTDKTETSSSNKSPIKSEKLLLQSPFEERISVYKTMVRESFARNKSVFLILPTVSDIEKFSKYLQKGIEQFTFVMHSGISAKKNIANYLKIISSSHPLFIISTPAYLSIPKKDIGTIILEHENSNAYKTIGRPYIDLRIFAEIYASKINARFVLADDILRYETIGRKEKDSLLPFHPLSYRIDFDGKIEIENPRKKEETEEKKEFKIFSEKTLENISTVVQNGKKVFVFSLRKGLATMTVCRDCGETESCKSCGAPLVLYMSHAGEKRMFVCNKCEKYEGSEKLCSNCGSWNLSPLGIGTDTVYEELRKHFPKEKIFKLDKETAGTKKGAEKIIKDFNKSEGAILIGTEMAFFYLNEEDTEKFSLSVVASFDSLWSIPNFKMGEKIIQILLSIISHTSKKIIIETKNEDDEILHAVKSGNLTSLIKEELENRKKLGYPPFKRFIKISRLADKEETLKTKKYLAQTFQEYSPEIFSGFVTKLRDKYVTNMLIKTNPPNWSLKELSTTGNIDENLYQKLSLLPPIFNIFIDPDDLL